MSYAAPLFLAELQPAAPLSRPAALVVCGSFAAVSLGLGIYFLSLGAWPVLGFFGLDAAGLWIAYELIARRARRREIIRLTATRLEVERIDATGRAVQFSLQPYWLRVEHDGAADWPMPVFLTSHGRRLEVGGFLGQQARRELASSLRDALQRWRG
ncbi:MAG: DUF2244 domain-containing protein [Thalassobaculales bacterium]